MSRWTTSPRRSSIGRCASANDPRVVNWWIHKAIRRGKNQPRRFGDPRLIPQRGERLLALLAGEAQDTRNAREGANPLLKLPHWNRLLASGIPFPPFRWSRQLTADLLAQGQHARDRLGRVLGERVEMSRQRSEELRRIVRSGADRQLSGLGLVTKGDLAAFERRLRAVSGPKTAQANTKRPTVRRGEDAVAASAAMRAAPVAKRSSALTNRASLAVSDIGASSIDAYAPWAHAHWP